MTDHNAMRIEEKVRKLRPVMGSQADAYRDLWIAEDWRGRQDVERLVDQEIHRHFPDPEQIALPPPKLTGSSEDGIPLGVIQYPNQTIRCGHLLM